jgi:hypothetical protein
VSRDALSGASAAAASDGEPQQPADASPGVPSIAVTGPVEVDITHVRDLPGPKRDLAWWITTAGSVGIAALGLIVAFAAVVYQRQANSTAQANATTEYASQVFIIQKQTSATFEIENLARAPIYSVWLYPAAREPLSLDTLNPCSVNSVTLAPASKPVIYFKDAKGVSWERTISGTLRQAVNPSALSALLPLGLESAFSHRISITTTTSPSCS